MKVYQIYFQIILLIGIDLRSDPSWVDKTLNSEKTMISLFGEEKHL